MTGIHRAPWSQLYFVVEEFLLDELPGDVRDDFLGRNLPELLLPRGDFFDLQPARPFCVECFLCH
jgi:hypothetical protein